MPIGKAPGYDSVSNEHFKYVNEKLYVLMSLLYSSMLIHGFIPDAMVITIIAPIIKKIGLVTCRITTTTDPLLSPQLIVNYLNL